MPSYGNTARYSATNFVSCRSTCPIEVFQFEMNTAVMQWLVQWRIQPCIFLLSSSISWEYDNLIAITSYLLIINRHLRTSRRCAQVSYVISQILNAKMQCNLFRQARKESTIFRSLSLDTSEGLVMRWSVCILPAVISTLPTGLPTVTQLHSLMVMLWPIFMFFIIYCDVFSLYQLFFQCCAWDWSLCFALLHACTYCAQFYCQPNKSALVKVLKSASQVGGNVTRNALISHWNEPVVHTTKHTLVWLQSISIPQGQH